MLTSPQSNVLHLQQHASKAGRTFAPIIAQKDIDRQELREKRRALAVWCGKTLALLALMATALYFLPN